MTPIRQAAEIYHHVTGLQREFTRFGNVSGICAVVSHSSHTSQLEFFLLLGTTCGICEKIYISYKLPKIKLPDIIFLYVWVEKIFY